jgi:hypothetical protein
MSLVGRQPSARTGVACRALVAKLGIDASVQHPILIMVPLPLLMDVHPTASMPRAVAGSTMRVARRCQGAWKSVTDVTNGAWCAGDENGIAISSRRGIWRNTLRYWAYGPVLGQVS